MTLQEDIVKLLDNAQSSLHHHQKLLKAFRELYDAHDPITFFEAFFGPFTNVLPVYKREPAVERVVDFVTKFATSVASKAPEGKALIVSYNYGESHDCGLVSHPALQHIVCSGKVG